MQRVLKFVKYLPDYGWQPIVLTVEGGDFPARDESLLKEISPSVPVYRVPAVEPYALYRKLTGKSKQEPLPVALLAKEGTDSLGEFIARWIRANLFVPDARVGWIPAVVHSSRQIFANHQIDAIYSSAPPHSVQLAALLLARKYRLPWIADFRDPWTDIFYYQKLSRTLPARRLDAFFERKVLSSADTVVSVSPSIIRNLQSKAPTTHFEVLYNGYDASDFSITSEPNSTHFTLWYIGNLKANQSPAGLWNALENLLQKDSDLAENLVLKFTGTVHPQVKASLEKRGFMDHIHIEGYVSHHEAIHRMQSASVLLFIIPDAPHNRGILTGKLFDYLASGRPFLSLGPPVGDAAAILERLQAGPMIAPENTEEIRARILYLYKLWCNNSLESDSPNAEKVKEFERKALTGRLAARLDALSMKQ